MAFNIFAQIYSSVFTNVRYRCKDQICANPFFVQWDNFPFAAPRRCKAVGKTQIIDGFYAFFLILAKAASSSLDTGNFLRKPMNDKKD